LTTFPASSPLSLIFRHQAVELSLEGRRVGTGADRRQLVDGGTERGA